MTNLSDGVEHQKNLSLSAADCVWDVGHDLRGSVSVCHIRLRAAHPQKKEPVFQCSGGIWATSGGQCVRRIWPQA